MERKRIAVIGAGFGGLSAAAYLAKDGHEVTVYEKNSWVGGRAQVTEFDGYRFDMGPSWYWMPEEHDRWFSDLGFERKDYYEITRVDPSYTVFYGTGSREDPRRRIDMPADFDSACRVFEKVESGAGERLRGYIEQCGRKYRFAMDHFIYKNYRSIFDFLNFTSMRNLSTLNVFSNYREMIRRYFRHPDLQKILEFPVVFLGSSAESTPAMYTLMNYIDFSLGTWYPDGGFSSVADAMYRVCRELGVRFEFETEVEAIESGKGRVEGLRLGNGREGGDGDKISCDLVVANADYPHVETELLDSAVRSIPEKRWRKKKLAPAVLNYFVALDRRLEGLAHHTFFFDSDWDEHFDAVYGSRQRWVERPLFYIHVPSVTDSHLAPEGGEVLYILIPAACGLSASEGLREDYFRHTIARMEEHSGMDISSHIVRYSSYSLEEFSQDYHAYRGTAFGLGQTMLQTAYFRPPNRSKMLSNLYYTGHYTVPGTGTTMSTISGRVVAQRIREEG